MKLKHLPIGAKLKLIIMVTSIIVLVLSSVLYIANDLMKLREAIVEKLSTVAKVIGANGTAAIVFNDRESAEEILSALKSEPHVIMARMYTAKGTVLAEYRNRSKAEDYQFLLVQKPASLAEMIDALSAGKRYVFHAKYMELLHAIVLDDEMIGVLNLRYGLDEYTSRIHQYMGIVAIVLLVSIAIAYLLSVRLQRFVSEPILSLARHMRLVSEGKDYSLRAKKDTTDEIGVLIEGFNEMMSEIQVRDDEVRRTEARLQHLISSTPAVIYSAEPYGVYGSTYISDNVEKLLGYRQEEFLRTRSFRAEHLHPEDAEQVRLGMMHLFTHNEQSIEYRFRKSDGTFVWLYDEMRLLRDPAGNPVEIIGYMIDITERKNLEAQLQRDALYDALTQLPNRTLLMDRLKVLLARSKDLARRQRTYAFAFLFLDIDRFKYVNDSYGHSVGDELLISIARRLEVCVRPGDTVARLGGDEFAIILEDVDDLAIPDGTARRIQQRLSVPFHIGEREIFTSASIGIAMSGPHYVHPEQVLRDADIAMYEAKTRGRSCHIVFDEPMHLQAMGRMQLENDLRRAIDRNEFLLHYQPVLSLGSGEVLGFEALIRWRHAERGLISPGEFIPVAEESGLITAIGKWVLGEACRQLRSWQQRFLRDASLTMSVNISARQFNQSLLDDIRAILDETKLDPRCLVLEITESVIMDRSEYVHALLTQLRAMNIRIHIDDFGTGYSSLSYLHHIPVDVLKIDRSFILEMHLNSEKEEIVRTIIGLAHNLAKGVIAEGVETEAHQNTLTAMQCDNVQGFLYSRPLDAGQAETFLQSRAGGHVKKA